MERDRFRDLEYPDLDENYCVKHPNFPKEAYGGSCAYCTSDLNILIHEGFQINRPSRIFLSGLYLRNIANTILFMGIIVSLILSNGNPALFTVGIIFFYILFRLYRKLSHGIYILSKGSLYFLFIIPLLLIIIMVFQIMITLHFSLLFLVIILFFSIPVLLIQSDEFTRELFNLSENSVRKFRERYNFEPLPEKRKDRFILFLQRNILLGLSFILGPLILYFG